MSTSPNHRPELLAPAGDWEALRAAVANGADAVYFGLSNFNARHRATNFTLEELPEVMRYLHEHGVRGYIAFNTLIFSDELSDAVKFIKAIAEAGADAVIVQDLGLVRLIHRLAPALPIHASTQMTLTEPHGIAFVKRLGVERVILARELSVPEIARVAEQTDVPLEVFVHGALCVAYSGQCLTSEALGGRSANRGQCAQACRLPYEMVVDGQPRDLGDRAYLLSPQDLAAYDLIDDLVKLGVACFKIEGRLKSANYVANTTQTYRAALSAALEHQTFALPRQSRLDLEQSFSRGLTHGFLDGVNHQVLVQGRFPKSRGVRVGTVIETTKRGVIVELADDDPHHIKPGDGVVFDDGHPEQDEQGGRVYEVVRLGGSEVVKNRRRPAATPPPHYPITSPPLQVELLFAHGAVNLAALNPGNFVWKTDDPALNKRLQRTYASDRPAHRIPLSVHLAGRVGQPLQVTVRDDAGNEATVTWPGPLERALKHPLNIELAREQLGRLGETPFELASVTLDLPDSVLVPKSVLNDLRRQAVTLLLKRRETSARRVIAEPSALQHFRHDIRSIPSRKLIADSCQLFFSILVRTLDQLDAVLAWSPPPPLPHPYLIYCDFEDVRRYRLAVSRARDASIHIGLATLRVVKPGEESWLRMVASFEPNAVLIRNLAGLTFFREHTPHIARIGDFSLNVANELTADLLASEGLSRLTPSYDLNWDQLKAMTARIDPGLFEIVIHQHMPMFHMEHCVFAAFLSNGKDHRDCGRPCDHHKVDLRDRVGAPFPVVADAGCRNTVFNSVAQSAAEFLPRMQALGLRHFRVELLRETPDQVAPLLDRYARVLAGLDDGRETWRQLQALNQLGVTRGTLQMV